MPKRTCMICQRVFKVDKHDPLTLCPFDNGALIDVVILDTASSNLAQIINETGSIFVFIIGMIILFVVSR